MLIDTMPGAANTAPTPEATGKQAGLPKGRTSFEALLNAASDDAAASTAADTEDDELTVDELVTVPVIIPFVPVAQPQEAMACDETGESHVESTGENTVAADAKVAADANVATDSKAVTAEIAIARVAGQDSAVDAKTKADQQAPSIAVHESEGPRPEMQQRRSQRPRQIDPVDVFPAEGGNTGVVPPVAGGSLAPVIQAPEVKGTKPEPLASTPKMPAATDVQLPASAQEPVEADAQSGVKAEGSVVLPESGTNGIAIGEPGAGSRGAAGRLARVLDRLADAPMIQGAAAAARENTSSFTPGGNGQPSFGEWVREQLPQAVAGRAQAAMPAFNIVTPIQGESRVSEMIAIAGGTVQPGPSVAIGEHDPTSQLVQSLRMQFRDGIGEAVLKLKPEHLGSVSISLKVENGGLKASVQAEMPAVRQWLEAQQDTLRSALADHGLRLDQFEVEPDRQGQPQPGDEERERQQQRRRQARRLPQADEPVFEVLV